MICSSGVKIAQLTSTRHEYRCSESLAIPTPRLTSIAIAHGDSTCRLTSIPAVVGDHLPGNSMKKERTPRTR